MYVKILQNMIMKKNIIHADIDTAHTKNPNKDRNTDTANT